MTTSPAVISRRELANEATLRRLDLACREWGLFYLVEHGIPNTVQDDLFVRAAEFFKLSRSLKNSVRRSQQNAWGYFDMELTKNVRDCKEIFDFGPVRGCNIPQWPQGMQAFRVLYEAYYRACENLAFDLLAAISENLGVGGTFLHHAFQPEHSSFMRLNYFPIRAEPAPPATPVRGHLGVNHHTDSGALTLLLTDDQPGLEVFVGDRWREVPPLRGAMIVNLGDVVQVWSNDRYTAPLHRVRNDARTERFSIPFFFNPHENCDYAPLHATTSVATPARYRAINWGEFRALRAAGDYADSGTEIQIDQYRIEQTTE